MDVRGAGLGQMDVHAALHRADRVRRLARGVDQPRERGVVRVDIDGIEPLVDADARAVPPRGNRILHAVVAQRHRARAPVLREQLGEIAARPKRLGQRLLHMLFVNHVSPSRRSMSASPLWRLKISENVRPHHCEGMPEIRPAPQAFPRPGRALIRAQANSFSSASNRSCVISASRSVPRSLMMYVQRPYGAMDSIWFKLTM